MGCNGLRLSGPLEHEQLGEDEHRLQENGEGPQNFSRREVVVENKRKEEGRSDEICNFEGVN